MMKKLSIWHRSEKSWQALGNARWHGQMRREIILQADKSKGSIRMHPKALTRHWHALAQPGVALALPASVDINHTLNRGQRKRNEIKSVINFGANIITDVWKRKKGPSSEPGIFQNARESLTVIVECRAIYFPMKIVAVASLNRQARFVRAYTTWYATYFQTLKIRRFDSRESSSA